MSDEFDAMLGKTTVRLDTVLNTDSKVLFKGSTHETVYWLEGENAIEAWWVCIGETGDLITASQYLDLASEDDDIVLDRDLDAVTPWYLGGAE
jgi:hypothetical protein